MLRVNSTVRRNVAGIMNAVQVLRQLTAAGRSVRLGENERLVLPETQVLGLEHVPHPYDPGHYFTVTVLRFLEGISRVDGGADNLLKITRNNKPVSVYPLLRHFTEAEMPEDRSFESACSEVRDLSVNTLLRIGWFLRDSAVNMQYGNRPASFLMPRSRVMVAPGEIASHGVMHQGLRIMGFRVLCLNPEDISRFGRIPPTHYIAYYDLKHNNLKETDEPFKVVDIVAQENGLTLKLSRNEVNFDRSYKPDQLEYVWVTTAKDPVVR